MASPPPSAALPAVPLLGEWASALVQHLQLQRHSHAPLSPTLPRLLAPAAERYLRRLIDDAIKIQRRSRRSMLTVDDINFALSLQHREVTYGFTSTEKLQVTNWQGQDDVVFLDEQDVDLADVIESPLPPCPLETTCLLHWLAVDGQQPNIPQNPVSSTQQRAEPGAAASDVREVAAHVLSKEMQLVFDKSTAAIKSGNDTQQRHVFARLRNDPGLQELVPYFSRFVSQQVTKNLKNTQLLRSIMALLRCLFANQFVHLELYLHQIIPAVLTCVVGKKLSASPTDGAHWALREEAAQIVAWVCKQYGQVYTTLQPRITKTLFEAVSKANKPLTTQYGAIVGITQLGAISVELLLLPLLDRMCKQLETILHAAPASRGEAGAIKLLEAQQCYNALLSAVTLHLRQDLRPGLPLPSREQSNKRPRLVAEPVVRRPAKRFRKSREPKAGASAAVSPTPTSDTAPNSAIAGLSTGPFGDKLVPYYNHEAGHAALFL